MKKLKFLSFILIFSVLAANVPLIYANALSNPPIQSKAVVLMDAATGNILFSKDGDEKVYPASTTKIMTVLLAVEAIEAGKAALSDKVTAGSNITADLSEDGSTSGIVPGETMTLENLLYCAMLSSANEACNIIADHIGGSMETFVGMMNSRAQELGCTGTHFANTHGLPNSNHYTTANDLAKIAREAYSHPLFMEICNTAEKTIPATNMSDERKLQNTNGLINKNSELYQGYYYEYARGIKTGHTNDAGYCLVSSASKNDINLLCVVMGGQAIKKTNSTQYTNFTDSIEVYNWAFENYSYRDILETTDLVKDIPVKMGKDAEYVTVRPQNAVKALMPKDEDNSSFEQKVTIYCEENGEELVAPVEAGEVLGEISIERDGVTYGQSKLVACSSVDVSYSQLIKAQIAKTLKKPLTIVFIIIVLALFGFYVYLVMHYRAEKKRRIKEMKIRQRAKASQPSGGRNGKMPARTRKEAPQKKYFDDLSYMEPKRLNKSENDYFEEFFGRDRDSKQ